MKAAKSLNLGSNDAENYRRSEQKQFFNDIFVKDINLERLLQLRNYFLIGEKGTGKTAYAVFLANNDYKNTKSQIKYIRETEYLKFISLKEKNHLLLSDYAAIWKVLLLVLMNSKLL
jgi:DNA replication protein DnaC